MHRRARRAGSRARAGATCSTAMSWGPRRPVACGPASGFGSRHREVVGMAGEAVGFIGLGIMGSRQAMNLRRAGFELTVFNRTRATAEAWGGGDGGAGGAPPAHGGGPGGGGVLVGGGGAPGGKGPPRGGGARARGPRGPPG